MIKLSQLTERTIRETSAQIEIKDEETGELKTEDLRIQYYSPTIEDQKKERETIAALDENEIYWYSIPLARRLHALPSVVDDDGNPAKITQEVLEKFPWKVLDAIREAIEKDLRPPQADEKSPAGSKAKAR